MAKPTSSFNIDPSGLSVKFTDRSAGVVLTRLWDFGDNSTSTESSPTHVYAQPGLYRVSLAVSNADGSSTFTYDIVVKDGVTMNASIRELVKQELPMGIVADDIVFGTSVRKWQLYFQASFDISNANVYNESAWPGMVNVLIAKLIVFDLIMKAANGAMIAFSSASSALSQLQSSITEGTIMVADYSIDLTTATYPITINTLLINGISSNGGPFANSAALLNFLNGLNKGQFIFDGDVLKSLGNPNVITTFNITHNSGAINGTFTQSNPRVVNIAQSNGGSSTSPGQVKRMESGPSVVEWYDSSEFWSNIFKSSGGQGGVIDQVKMDICTYASNVKVHMPMCNSSKVGVAPIVVRSTRYRGLGGCC